ncbi:stringent starvation protein B [Luminiphilus syltensis NOR5-1B]|uniref:Stringent starvation protein B n=1 Tax=Luminiphilus syltensis NOR5-1B TaxID=565045 RepID=B8KR66_9GAMM|nr:ClpXP protease specificity-enhancing factor [Luminiphilus syltensis]EED35490.1 stringent starvation protein B [Luminiphilus syltensis NOR5-1B]
MTPSRPYIIRAIYDWIVDNDCTPHLLVDAAMTDVEVPESYVVDGQIVLNISPTAVVSLQLGNDAISFNGRFGGRPFDIFVPIAAVMGIYARENGQGMVFDAEPEPEPPDSPTPEPDRTRPALRVVK